MGFQKNDSYHEVKDRVVEFRAKHPEGSLQSDPIEWVRDEANRIIGITIQARAYRTPDDPRPGVGTAFEFYPGKTPYTKGSEAQNAETSAWGRALIAVGAADASKGIASADEVRRATGARESSPESSEPPFSSLPAKREKVRKIAAEKQVSPAELKAQMAAEGITGKLDTGTEDQVDRVLDWLVGL